MSVEGITHCYRSTACPALPDSFKRGVNGFAGEISPAAQLSACLPAADYSAADRMLAGTASGTRWQSSSAPPGEALPGSRGRLQGLSSRTTGRCLISLILVSGVLQKLLVCPQVWQVQVWIPTLSWRHQHPSKVSPGRREALSKKPRCLDVCAARGRDSQPSTFSPRRGVPSHPNGSLPSAGSALILSSLQVCQKRRAFLRKRCRSSKRVSASLVITLPPSLPFSPSLHAGCSPAGW